MLHFDVDIRRLATVLFSLSLMTVGSGWAQPSSAPYASVTQGTLVGSSKDGVDVFMGIPYAKPPVGDLRWRAPEVPIAWFGARDATSPGAICPQPIRPGSSGPASSEDCLFVNVWRPAGTKPGAKLPVMLWYHGGGMVFGSGSATDGRYLARKGVILVTMNYRLGWLGVFAHPALTAENPKALTGNFTLMDGIAALKWVRSNVAAFGGDPGNVTIFGFSAGAQIVNTLMVTPSASGLFAKAITQSGLGRNYGHQGQNRILPVRGPATLTGEKAGIAMAQELGVRGTGQDALTALRAIPAERFRIAVTSLPGSMIDGMLLPEPIASAYKAGREAPVPQIIGRTICERCGVESIEKQPAATFARAGSLRAKAITLYGGDGAKAAVAFASDLDHVEPARYLSRFHARRGRNIWSYVFDHTTGSKRGAKSRPSHGDDIAYIFGTLRDPDARDFEPTAGDLAVSDAMMTYWTNFAKMSDPGTAEGTRWARFDTPSEENVMIFSNRGPELDKNFERDKLDLAEQINNRFQGNSFVAN